jgi:valyl-tRNA synthetase
MISVLGSEMIKPAYQQPIDSVTFLKAIEMLENN